jgi:hypothetical protein
MSVTLSSMSSPGEPAPSWNSFDTGGVRAEALDVVSDALQWRLADARWIGIERVLAAMDTAIAANDVAALATATADLELAGPVRIIRIGTVPVGPPPSAIRDRLNRLVHSLGGISVADRPEPGQAGSGEGSTVS